MGSGDVEGKTEATEEIIETAWIGGDNFESILVSDPTISARGSTQTYATNNIRKKLRDMGHLDILGRCIYRY